MGVCNMFVNCENSENPAATGKTNTSAIRLIGLSPGEFIS
jgi:hypothetical protein